MVCGRARTFQAAVEPRPKCRFEFKAQVVGEMFVLFLCNRPTKKNSKKLEFTHFLSMEMHFTLYLQG